MFGLTKGPTVLRQTVSRVITDTNIDLVVMAQPVPPGSTVQQISLDYSMISKHKQDTWNWNKYTLHGCFVGLPDPKHGFNQNIGGYDTMWDNYVPKDIHPSTSMEDQSGDSYPTGDMTSESDTDTGAIESGNVNNEFGEISGDIITVKDAPEFFFSREQRLDVTNGIVVDSDGDAGKFLAVDKVRTQVNKSYYLDPSRYWFCLMAVGMPSFGAGTGNWDFHPETEYEWLNLAAPELFVLEGLIRTAHDASVLEDVRKQLETYYIEADTVHDLADGGGSQEFVLTMESTLNYKRPRLPAVSLNADAI